MSKSLLLTLLALASPALAFDPGRLTPLGVNVGGIAYWSAPSFANAMWGGEGWLTYSGSEFGTPADLWSGQFDANGYPRYLNPGERLRGLLYGMHANYWYRPASWPVRDDLARGRVVVTWRGNGDIRLNTGAYLAAESSGPATGSLVDGRRVYLLTGAQATNWVEVHEVLTPITQMRVFLPQPDDPATPQRESELGSLEGQLFHPSLVRRLAEHDWSYVRVMQWGQTQASPQQDWADRRPPEHAFMTGVLNRRAPANGFPGDRMTGVAFEHMVALANAAGKDLWISVPHLATDDFVTRLARLALYGSDGVEPYDHAVANPRYPPLRADLSLWVEYSNEIWSNGNSFPQGNWAQDQANALGITRAQFVARRSCRIFSLFTEVFGGTGRLVRVAGAFTADESYTRGLLAEMAAHGPSLSPAARPDVLAVTTYFGNGIQDWVNAQGFTRGRLYDDPYWTGAAFAADLTSAFREWTRRLLAGDASQGGGFDQTGVGGGYAPWVRTVARETLGQALPLVAYEGGPSLYTDYMDGGAANAAGVPTDDGVTTFVEAMNRRPEIADVYRIHLALALSKGLTTHSMYEDTSFWGKYGQWGHLEFPGQAPSASPKYAFLMSWANEARALRSVDAPLGAAPGFATAPALPHAVLGQPYQADVVAAGGDGTRAVTLVGSWLAAGLSAAPVAGDPDRIRIAGTLTEDAKSYLLLRVVDRDGDPAWRVFSIESIGGPGTLVQSDFRGASPALALPWTRTFFLAPGVSFGGWRAGSGMVPRAGDDALVFSVHAPGGVDQPLADAIAANQYWTARITPSSALDLRGARVRFGYRRLDWFAPRSLALTTSLTSGALCESEPLFYGDFDEHVTTCTLPETAAFAAVTQPLELRLYAAGAQYSSHRASLISFKVTSVAAPPPPPPPPPPPAPLAITTTSLPDATAKARYAVTIQAANGTAPLAFSIESGALPQGITLTTAGLLSGTPKNPGTSSFSVRVRDAAGATATRAFTLRVNPKR